MLLVNRVKRPIVYQRFQPGAGARLLEAQEKLEKSIADLGLEALAFPAPQRGLARFGDLLSKARSEASGSAIVWCNTDVILTANPFLVGDPEIVWGFNRREIPSGEIIGGVDMLYIPLKWWDSFLAKDIPGLYLGASYVDWWIPKAMEKAGAYATASGFIDHPSHPRSEASGNDADPYYQKNFRSYNAWAKRNALEPIPAPPFLVPGIGHAWGFRDAFFKFFAGKNQRKRNFLLPEQLAPTDTNSPDKPK